MVVALAVALFCAGGYAVSQNLYLNGSAGDLTGYVQRLDSSAAPILATVLLRQGGFGKRPKPIVSDSRDRDTRIGFDGR
jgi:hypothetical protein